MKEQLEKLKNTLKEKISQEEQESYPFECETCQDTGIIITSKDGYEVIDKCKCRIKKEIQQRTDNSGLAGLVNIKTFDNFRTEKPFQKMAKDLALEYTEEFKAGNKMSFVFLGQSGIGKSHLLTAISGELLEHNVNVKHYTADEILQKLHACKYDEDNYNLEFGKIANCGLLFIDDLFKSSVTNYYKQESIKQEDLREMFKLINYRYNKRLPMLVNSEIHFERFMEIDQAIIGRLKEMCDHKYLISVKPDNNKNYRLFS